MTRTGVFISSCVAVVLGALFYWVASNSDWVDTKLPTPLRGEARTNPFYAAQRLAEALHVHATRDGQFTVPPPDAVVVLSAWNWDLSTARRVALERWVESGGRLVVDSTVRAEERAFEQWSQIAWHYPDDLKKFASDNDDPCHTVAEDGNAAPNAEHFIVCDVSVSALTTTRTPQWALRDRLGIQALRVAIGRGSVTVVNADPFRYRDLLDGDHAALLVAAAQFRAGDDVHFLSENDHPSLSALVWQHGAPVVVLALVLITAVLWRGGVRFGPRSAPSIPARRSLAEQIRGSGQFALRYGRDALHAACVRALDEAARRRVNGYARLTAEQRAAALSRVTGVDARAIVSAEGDARARRPQELRRAIAVLESARREALLDRKKLAHGTR